MFLALRLKTIPKPLNQFLHCFAFTNCRLQLNFLKQWREKMIATKILFCIKTVKNLTKIFEPI